MYEYEYTYDIWYTLYLHSIAETNSRRAERHVY